MQTRVLIYGSQGTFIPLLRRIVHAADRGRDFVFAPDEIISTADFFVLETTALPFVADFQPNIIFATSETSEQDIKTLANAIMPGGIFLLSEDKVSAAAEAPIFFRRLSFKNLPQGSTSIKLETDFGAAVFAPTELKVLRNAEGLQLLCRQLGLPEAELVECLLS